MGNCIHLINYFRQGGAENVAYNYIKALNDLNINSTIVGKPHSERYEQTFAELANVEYYLSDDMVEKADYIFIHSNQCLLKLLKYFGLIKKREIRVIYIQHLRYSERKFRLLSRLINMLCTDFVQITPITSTLIEKYIKIKIHFIVNFHINKYNPNQWASIRAQVREKLNIPHDAIVVTYSGIFKPGKNVGEFIQLAKEMQDNSDYKFLLIGDGVESDVVKAYKGENLIWIGCVNDVEQYLIASNIYTFLSVFKMEMMPMALIEAINTDKHIIAYPTEINKFLLAGKTFETIDRSTLFSNKLPSGSVLKHYDRAYAHESLQKLLNL